MTPEQTERALERRRKYRAENRERFLAVNEAWKARNGQRLKDYQERQDAKASLRKKPDAVMEMITKSLPSGVPKHVRDDIVGTMCLAVLEGKLLVNKVKAEVGKYLAAHYREFDTFKTGSLDATIPGTDKCYIDDVASDAEHF